MTFLTPAAPQQNSTISHFPVPQATYSSPVKVKGLALERFVRRCKSNGRHHPELTVSQGKTAAWSGQRKSVQKNETVCRAAPGRLQRARVGGVAGVWHQVSRFALQRAWSRSPQCGCGHRTRADQSPSPAAQRNGGTGGWEVPLYAPPQVGLQSQSWKPGSIALQVCGTFSNSLNLAVRWHIP